MNHHTHWIMKHGRIAPVPLMIWARWFETSDRRLHFTDLGNVKIYTTFLGLDHRMNSYERPEIIETMIFGGKCNNYFWRCATLVEAKAQHQVACEMARGDS